MIKIAIVLTVTALISGCPGTDDKCAACQGVLCRLCYDGFANNLGKCQSPNAKIAYCLQYSNDTFCKICQDYYYPDALGQCQPIGIVNCVELDSNDASKCKVCAQGIRERGGVCDPAYKCAQTGCSYCLNENGVEKCARCSVGFQLSNVLNTMSCVPQIKDISNCYLLDQTGTKCAICDINYFYSNGSCLKSNAYILNINGKQDPANVSQRVVVVQKMSVIAAVSFILGAITLF